MSSRHGQFDSVFSLSSLRIRLDVMTKRAAPLFVVVAFVSLLFAGLTLQTSGQSRTRRAARPRSRSATVRRGGVGARQGGAKNERELLPDLTSPTLDGRAWNLKEHRGKVVLMNFWATWCGPCRSEIPALVRLGDKYRARGLEVVGVSLDDGAQELIKEFVAQYNVNYPVLLPAPGSALAVQRKIPMSILIDREGRLAKKYVGAADEEIFERDLRPLLGAAATSQSDSQTKRQRKDISRDVTIDGQISPDDIGRAAREGFKSILNLRAADEEGALVDEARQVRGAGLAYVQLPFRRGELSDELMARAVAKIEAMPKPALVHCATGVRAGLVAFAYRAEREGLTADEALRRAESEGFLFAGDPRLREFLRRYLQERGHPR